jgi:hypothetical protein
MYCCSYHGLAQAVAVATDVAAATTALVTAFFFLACIQTFADQIRCSCHPTISWL